MTQLDEVPPFSEEDYQRRMPVAECSRSDALPDLELGADWIPGDHGEVDTLEARSRRITLFSARSRARLMYRMSTLDFEELPGIPEMVTLTYPREYPTDGSVCKAHLFAFAKRWQRRWGSRPVGVWKMEFQRRGAPHFHVYVGRPAVPWRVFLDWARTVWFEIVSSGDPLHLDQGVRLDRQFVSAVRSKGKISGYFAKHNAKGSKALQNKVPEGFENVGRWWGVWSMERHEHEVVITRDQMVQFRRALYKLREARTRRKVRRAGRLIGTWSMCDDGYEVLAALVMGRGRWSFSEWSRSLDVDRLVLVDV